MILLIWIIVIAHTLLHASENFRRPQYSKFMRVFVMFEFLINYGREYEGVHFY